MSDILEIERHVHWVHLANLLPDTTYYFVAGDGSDIDSYSSEHMFRTFNNNGTLHFVAGGDMGVTDIGQQVRRNFLEIY